MQQLENIYVQFLNNFPVGLRSIISIVLAVLFVYALFKTLKRDFIFIIVLIILLPGSIPILKSIWQGLVQLVAFMLHAR